MRLNTFPTPTLAKARARFTAYGRRNRQTNLYRSWSPGQVRRPLHPPSAPRYAPRPNRGGENRRDPPRCHRRHPWTFNSLRAEGFPDEILAALECVTKRDDETYKEFVNRSATNPIARQVKLADLEDNMDDRRIPEITPKDLERLAKYRKAWSFLRDANP